MGNFNYLVSPSSTGYGGFEFLTDSTESPGNPDKIMRYPMSELVLINKGDHVLLQAADGFKVKLTLENFDPSYGLQSIDEIMGFLTTNIF